MNKNKYQNKYRIPSSRLQKWDYGSDALYFITICTHNRLCFFGNIIDHEMQLSKIGNIVEYEWLKTYDLRQDMNLNMGNFVIMPNHFHAIIGIGENQYNTQHTTQCATQRRDARHCISTINITNPNDFTDSPKNKFGYQSKNLASIIRGFKSAVTITARKIDPCFQWQSRFYDRIIRNDGSFQRISNYIINNPANWKEDKFNNTEQTKIL